MEQKTEEGDSIKDLEDIKKFISKATKQEIIEAVSSCVPIETLEKISLSIYRTKSGCLLAELDELTEEIKTAEENGKFFEVLKKLAKKNKEIDVLYHAYKKML